MLAEVEEASVLDAVLQAAVLLDAVEAAGLLDAVLRAAVLLDAVEAAALLDAVLAAGLVEVEVAGLPDAVLPPYCVPTTRWRVSAPATMRAWATRARATVNEYGFPTVRGKQLPASIN